MTLPKLTRPKLTSIAAWTVTALCVGQVVAGLLFSSTAWINAGAGTLTLAGLVYALINFRRRDQTAKAAVWLRQTIGHVTPEMLQRTLQQIKTRQNDGVVAGLLMSTCGSLLSSYAESAINCVQWLNALAHHAR